MNDIEQLAAEYNAIEEQQRERLWRLFQLMNARKGYRHIRFDGQHMWGNCWGLPETVSYERFVKDMAEPITEIVAGTE